MINIVSYLTEKFKISANTPTDTLVAKAYSFDNDKYKEVTFKSAKNFYPDSPVRADYDKMHDYFSKGSKPIRLVNSIKDRSKLERRFSVAIEMGWDDAINEFGKALIEREKYDENSIIAYIYKRFKGNGRIKD